MGIVIRQSIKNSIYSYLGVAIGAFYTLFMVKEVFSKNPEEWGLIQLFTNYALLFMPFALLGFSNTIIKFWPVYKLSRKDSFSSFLFFIVVVGTLITSALIFFFRKHIFFSSSNTNSLIETYYPYFFIFFVIHTFFYVFINFGRVYLRTSFPTFLKDSYIKFWTFFVIGLYWLFKINFQTFFILYFTGFLIQLILLVMYLSKDTNFKFSFTFDFFQNLELKTLVKYGSFSLLTGSASVLVSRIDIFMINKLISLEEVAFYSIALFFITVLQVPLRSLLSIAVPILSSEIANKNMDKVKDIYSKTSINLILISSFIFMVIALNINEFMQILGETFGQIKYVILLLGIAKLYEIANSLNSSLIIISKYYVYDIYFQVLLLIITVCTNLFFIPRFGINGAAIATGLSLFINSSIKGIFVYLKFGLQPFSKKTLFVIVIIIVTLILCVLIPFKGNVYFIIILKSILISLTYLLFTIVFKISDELLGIYRSFLKILKFETD